MVNRVFIDDRFQNETIKFLLNIFEKEQSHQIMADYFGRVFNREDVLKNLNELLTNAAWGVLADEALKGGAAQTMIVIMHNPMIQEALWESLTRTFLSPMPIRYAEKPKSLKPDNSLDEQSNKPKLHPDQPDAEIDHLFG